MRQVRGEIPASCLSFIPMYSRIFCPVTVRVADFPENILKSRRR